MPTIDPRVDAYIAAAAPFAQPILHHLRAVIHETCPEAREVIKWQFPHFDYRGSLCGMAAFKAHATFGFWLDEQVLGRATGKESEAMGQFGRLTSVRDLPAEPVLRALIQKAMALNEAGVKRTVARSKTPKPEAKAPADLAAALKRSAAARATWEKFSPSHRREYVEWLEEAKRPETRARRLATTLEQLAEGKSRNWKYQRT